MLWIFNIRQDRREALKEETLDDLPSKDERGPSQTNIGTVSKATLGKFLKDGVERNKGFSERTDTILN